MGDRAAMSTRSGAEHCGVCDRSQAGFTLVELVVAIVIIAMAATTIVGVMSAVSTRSADVMVQVQAMNVADAYLREILAQPFADPDGIGGEMTRTAFDDVNDYDGLSNAGAEDQYGNAVAGLNGYQVGVVVAAAALGAIPAAQSRLITVTVTGPTQTMTLLRGYKTMHP